MSSTKKVQSKKTSNESKVECHFCHKLWDGKGIGNHRRACEKKHLLALQQKEYEKQVAVEASNPTRKSFFVFLDEYDLIHYYYLAAVIDNATFRSSSHSGSNLKPWEQYGHIGKYLLSL
jgi:hypothetical protein